MGGNTSKPQIVKSTGVINNENINNIVVEDSVKVHNDSFTIMMYIIVALLIFNTCFKIYKEHQKCTKKKYQSRFALERV